MIFEFGGCRVDVDVVRTRSFYEHAPRVGEQCSCDGCRNYDRAADTFPEAVLAFFSSLGADPRKPCEVYVNDPNHGGMLLYGGFYHLCGTVLSGAGVFQPGSGSPPGWSHVTQKFHVCFHEDCALLEDGFPRPAIQMEIDAEIPWVLEQENSY